MRAPILIAALLLTIATPAQSRPAQAHPGGNRPLREIEREEYNLL